MASSSSSLTANYVYNSSFFSKFLLRLSTSSGAPFSLHLSYCKLRLQEVLYLHTSLAANIFKSSFLFTLILRQTTSSRAPLPLLSEFWYILISTPFFDIVKKKICFGGGTCLQREFSYLRLINKILHRDYWGSLYFKNLPSNDFLRNATIYWIFFW